MGSTKRRDDGVSWLSWVRRSFCHPASLVVVVVVRRCRFGSSSSSSSSHGGGIDLFGFPVGCLLLARWRRRRPPHLHALSPSLGASTFSHVALAFFSPPAAHHRSHFIAFLESQSSAFFRSRFFTSLHAVREETSKTHPGHSAWQTCWERGRRKRRIRWSRGEEEEERLSTTLSLFRTLHDCFFFFFFLCASVSFSVALAIGSHYSPRSLDDHRHRCRRARPPHPPTTRGKSLDFSTRGERRRNARGGGDRSGGAFLLRGTPAAAAWQSSTPFPPHRSFVSIPSHPADGVGLYPNHRRWKGRRPFSRTTGKEGGSASSREAWGTYGGGGGCGRGGGIIVSCPIHTMRHVCHGERRRARSPKEEPEAVLQQQRQRRRRSPRDKEKTAFLSPHTP